MTGTDPRAATGGIDRDAWPTDVWRDTATTWMDGCLAQRGHARTGAVEQPRIRPWATVLTATTTGGRVWLKATAPATSFEVPLYRTLVQSVPGRVLEPWGSDAVRGWILLPDGGPVVRDHSVGDAAVPILSAAVERYGRMQRDLQPVEDELLSDGVVDMRPARIPERFEEALLIADRADRELYDRIAALRPVVREWSDALQQSSRSGALDHNDLHPGNILLAAGASADTVRFYDWGDSVFQHPFASMLVPVMVLRDDLSCAADDPRVVRVVDAYLDGFATPGEPRRALLAELKLACRVAQIARALVWARAITQKDGTLEPAYAEKPLETFATLLDDSTF